MRVVHLTQYFMPWLGYQEFYLPREQVRMGHDVTVVTSNLRWPLGNYSVLAEKGLSQEMETGPGEEQGVARVRLPVARRVLGRLVLDGLAETLADLAPEVVISHLVLTPHTLTAARLQPKLGYRLIVDEHQLPSQKAPGALHVLQRRASALAARALIYPRVHRFVAVAPGCVDWMTGEYGIARERIEMIPLGVDDDVFFPDATRRAEVRAELGADEGALLAIYTGKISPYKRVETLIEAAAIVAAKGERIVCAAIGSAVPEYRAELERVAGERGVSLAVRPSAPAAELAAYFNAADVCVWPADCTISHLEAAGCGKPIAISADARVEDRISGGNGVMVNPGDADGLAAFLLEMARNPEKRREMGDAGYGLVKQRYTWRAVAEAFEKVATS